MPPEDLNESSDSEDFSWSEYLKENNAQAAPAAFFCQALTPPDNNFQVDSKLETFDPRNTTSTCLGTVIEKSGPRVRLRLDGTDDRNDFWLMVDSDLIHPYGHSARNGRKIQPPLGFGNDLSKWPKFLEKIIQSADERVFASDDCFKAPPFKPLKNEFKTGQKLEAVDPKNPHLICPATIKEVKRDKILVTFDGWLQSSQCWYSFSSRDIFPVGWCKLARHILQYPGHLVDRKLTNSSMNQSKNAEANKPVVKKKPNQKVKANSRNSTDNANMSSDSSGLNITATNDTLQTNHAVSTPNNKPLAQIDLSIVKQEACDAESEEPSSNGHLKNVNLNSNGEIHSSGQKASSASGKKGASNAYVHLIPGGSCGPFIKTDKFHQAHTKFGPGSASSVYKSIIQSFVDCAVSRYDVFKLIPEGTSSDIVRLKNTTYNERKRLILVETSSDMWSSLKSFCKLIEIDDEQLFSRHKSTGLVLTENDKPDGQQQQNKTIKSEKKQSMSPQKYRPIETKSAAAGPALTTDTNNNGSTAQVVSPLTPQASSLASSASPNENHFKTNNKRSVNSRESLDGQTQAKMSKLDESTSFIPLQTSDWSVDQVVNYISQLHNSYFVSYVDTFKSQEIDGKALVLLTTDILMKYMGFKLGPALKLNNYIEKLRKNIIENLNNGPMNSTAINSALKCESKEY